MGDQVLLARHRYHAEKRFALIAGFVEEGESVEEAATREVFEEIGLTMRIGTTLGSFAVESTEDGPLRFVVLEGWADSALVTLGDELEEAAWFGLDNLPDCPDVVTAVLRSVNPQRPSNVP
jgi:NAD+ diphosphatase